MKRILIADDSPHDIELTLTALERFHLTDDVMTVCDGVEALDYLHQRGAFAGWNAQRPDVVVLDLKMPRLDGLQVLRHIKSDPELKRLPVVMFTSSREERDLVESYDLGVNAYVVKPVEFRQFVDAVQNLGIFWAMINETPPSSALPADSSQ